MKHFEVRDKVTCIKAYNVAEKPKTVFHCDCCGDDIREGEDYYYCDNPNGIGYIHICSDCLHYATAEKVEWD